MLRRVTGKSPGTFLKEEVAGPLKADFFIGTPESEDARTAEMLLPIPEDGDVPNPLAAIMADKESLPGRVFGNPPRPPSVANTRRWRGAEIPSSNGHGSARGIAKVYAALAGGGESAGVRLMSAATVDEARKERVAGKDVILGMDVRRSLGFMLPVPELRRPTRAGRIRARRHGRLHGLRRSGTSHGVRIRDEPDGARHRHAFSIAQPSPLQGRTGEIDPT